MVDFLIVIPAYSESGRLLHGVKELAAALAQESWTTALQVVDDGSPFEEQEAEAGILTSLRADYPSILPLYVLPHNQGKGAAIRAGWARGTEARWLVFVDADGAVPAAEVVRLCRLAVDQAAEEKSYFASRIKMLGRKVQRHLWRHYIGRGFATWVGLVLNPSIYDSQCGCKIVPASVYRRIEPCLEEKGFAFDVELLAALEAIGAPIVEVPVDWKDIDGSKVKFSREAWGMLAAVVRIRRRRRQGAFRP
jgi:glycosyltransferase involved in cell wall biosynthesis